MKRIIIYLFIFIFFLGCSRSNNYINNIDNTTIDFYYTNVDNVLFEYSHEYGVNKIGIEGTQSVNYLSNDEIQLSTNSSFSIMAHSGVIEFNYEPNDEIAVAVIDSLFLDMVYYITTKGELKRYNRVENTSDTLLTNIYPLPKQIVIDNDQSVIYYHTKRNVIKLNLNTLEKETLLTQSMPIQSIAVCKDSGVIYIASSVEGKIYDYNQNTKNINIFYHTMSAAGSTIWLNSKNSELYFSRSNGRDIEINKIELSTKKVSKFITLNNIFYINNLVIKD